MDRARRMHGYLPLACRNPAEAEYLAFLWETFETNYQNGNYQFALLAYHMLCMSSVYVAVWQIKLARPDAFAHALLFQKEAQRLRAATSPFAFSKTSERGILRFLHLTGCDDARIAQLGRLVAERNNMAHANGHIFCRTQGAAERKIENILDQLQILQNWMTPLLQASFEKFLADHAHARRWHDPEAKDQVWEHFIQPYYLSPSNVSACLRHRARPAVGNGPAARLCAALSTALDGQGCPSEPRVDPAD